MKPKNLSVLNLFAILFGLILVSNDVFALQFSLTEIGTFGGNTVAKDINESGQVVGTSVDSNGHTVAFLFEDGTMTSLGSPLGGDTRANAINDLGQVAFFSYSASGSTWYGYRYDSGSYTLISPATYSSAEDINNSGVVVGYENYGTETPIYFDSTTHTLNKLGRTHGQVYGINDAGQMCGITYNPPSQWQAFYYDGVNVVDIGTLGGSLSNAKSINNSNQIVGFAHVAGNQFHAFLYGDNNMIDLGVLNGDTESFAWDINDLGQVVGQSSSASNERAFLYDDNQLYDLNTLTVDLPTGWTLAQANAINESGQIVGYASTPDGYRAFVLTPVDEATPIPEPVTGIAMLIGLVGLRIRKIYNRM